MNKIPLKIGLLFLPIMIQYLFNITFATSIYIIYPPQALEWSGTATGVTHSYEIPSYFEYIILPIGIYLSIKLWLRYVEK